MNWIKSNLLKQEDLKQMILPREYAGASTNRCAGGDHQRPQTKAPAGIIAHFILLPSSIIITLRYQRTL